MVYNLFSLLLVIESSSKTDIIVFIAHKTSLFKYILYSPGTILFHRLPAVQQMIVETTQAVENGNEAPWLKVCATCGLVGQGIKLWRINMRMSSLRVRA